MESKSATIYIPRHARGWSLTHIPVSTRLANVFRRMGLQILGDLHGLSFTQIKRAKNIGRQSIEELGLLITRVQSGEFEQISVSIEGGGLINLLRFLDKAIKEIPSRNREMLLMRYGGLGDKPKTLEEIGMKYSISRERVRQIIKKRVEEINKSGGPPMSMFLQKLSDKCLEEITPLTPELLSFWLKSEVYTCENPVSFYIYLFSDLKAEIQAWPEGIKYKPADGRTAVIIDRLKKLLLSCDGPLILNEVFEQLQASNKSLRLNAGEFLNAVKTSAAITLNLTDADRPRISLAKLGTREWARRVLSQAEGPLVPEVIIEQAHKLIGDGFDSVSPYSLANALRPEDGFYLLEPRAFGLRHHFRLPEIIWRNVRKDIYALLELEDRPISTSEIINKKVFDWASLTNAYELAQILREDKRFTDLGKFLFALSKWGIEERVLIKDLIPKVLRCAKHPLSTSEIYTELRSFRSVGQTSIPGYLNNNQDIRDYGFGYYGLKDWGDDAKTFLLSQTVLIDRIIRRADPPLTFNRLCQILEIPTHGHMADRLWLTLKSSGKIKIHPDEQSLDTELSHKSWKLDRALYATLSAEKRPLPVYEIPWFLNDRFGHAFEDRSAVEIERCLKQNHLFICNAKGEYFLDEHLDEYDVDIISIRQACVDILCSHNEIVGCDDLLERLETSGVNIKDLSPDMLAALLRNDNSFEEVGNKRFRVKR